MSITLEPNKGLRLKLDRFSPIRTWHGGGKFWSHEFQLTVRQGALAAFLPRAIEDDDSVLFEHRVGGVELASTSAPITNISEVPARELQNLRDAVDELKSKAEDPRCDRTKRQMIQSFRLPDPQTDRDLYRLTGKGSQQKLIVLWGVEREEGSAMAPSAALDLMHTPAEELHPAAQKKSKLIPVLACLAVLAAGGWYYWQQEQKKQQAATEAAMAAEKSRIAAFNARAAMKAATNPPGMAHGTDSAPLNSPLHLSSTSQNGSSAAPTPMTPTKSADPSKSISSVTPATDSRKSGILTNAKPDATKSPDSNKSPSTSLGSTSTPGRSMLPSKSPTPKPSEPDKSRAIASSSPHGSTPKVDKPKLANTPPTGGSIASKNSSTTAVPGTVVGDRKGVTGLPTTLAKSGTDVVTGVPGAAVRDSKVVSGGTLGSTTGLSATSVSTPMTAKGPPPAGISSLDVISTSLSPLLSGGNVEVLLNVVARDNAGTVVNAPPISEWRVDGVVRKKADGTPADGPVLPLALPAGKHNITTLGRGADGNPFQTDADVIVSPKE